MCITGWSICRLGPNNYRGSFSSLGSATFVGFGLLNYRWAFSAGRFLQSAVASGTSNPPNLEDQWFRTFQLSPQVVPSVWNDASEPQHYGREIAENFVESGDFWVLLRAVNLRHGPTALLSLRRKACWGLFRPKNPKASAGFELANFGTRGQHAYL